MKFKTDKMPASTIEEAIAKLEAIVEEARRTADPLGIFALVYLGVTRSVREGLRNGLFQDGHRMERLDVIFANRYLDAHAAYLAGKPCTKAWKSSFDAAKGNDLLVLQHLFMGMNAHINLDLSIAAAEAVPAAELPKLEHDFNAINALLARKIDAVQDSLGEVSPLLFLVDWFGKRGDERFAEFSLVKSRKAAWAAAKRLSLLSGADKALAINELDGIVARLNHKIAKPGRVLGWLIGFIKRWEEKEVVKVLDRLA